MPQLYYPFPLSTVTEWPGGMSDVRVGVHKGTDFGIPQGTPLHATADGEVRVYNGASGGWGIDIYTDDGWTIRNWHLSSIWVKTGQRVAVGNVIGATGGAAGHPGAGNSTGPHLHWELRTNRGWDAGWVDPRTLSPQPGTFGQDPAPATSTSEEDEMAFNTIRHPNGSIVFADEMGSESVLNYISADIGLSEYLEALTAVWGGTQELSARGFDIACAISDRRTNAFVNKIADVVAAKTGKISVDTAAIAKAVSDAVVAQGVKVDSTAIAKAVEASLQDEFARIPGAVADETASRLSK